MVWFFGVGARAFVVALFGAVTYQSFTNALKRAGIDTPKGQNTYYATLSLRNL
jgi:hypothetical protein